MRVFENKGSTFAYALISAVFTFVPDDCFKLFKLNNKWPDVINEISNRAIISIVIFIVVNLIYSVYRKKRKKVNIIGDNFEIQIEYGDLFDISDGKKLINFDECFTTKVGEAPSEIKPESICGQYLSNYPDINIQKLIDQTNVIPIKGSSACNNQLRYKPGTIVPNGDFLLMAFTRLNQVGLGYLTYEEYLDCLNTLWEQIDIYHGTSDVYIPILGSRITRFDKELNQQQLLDIIIASYRLSSKKLKDPCKLHIVCKPRKDFSLNQVFGID